MIRNNIVALFSYVRDVVLCRYNEIATLAGCFATDYFLHLINYAHP